MLKPVQNRPSGVGRTVDKVYKFHILQKDFGFTMVVVSNNLTAAMYTISSMCGDNIKIKSVIATPLEN